MFAPVQPLLLNAFPRYRRLLAIQLIATTFLRSRAADPRSDLDAAAVREGSIAADHAVGTAPRDFLDASPAAVHGWRAAPDSAAGSLALGVDFPGAWSAAVPGSLAAVRLRVAAPAASPVAARGWLAAPAEYAPGSAAAHWLAAVEGSVAADSARSSRAAGDSSAAPQVFP